MMRRMGQIRLHCVLLALLAVMTATAQGTCSSNVLPGIPGRNGRDGRDGLQGPIGQKGSKGDAGSSGVTYVRWGRTVCPQGTSTVYTGVAAGTKYDTKGGTSDTLCLASNPQYRSGDGSSPTPAYLSKVKYAIDGGPLNEHHTYDTPCAFCHTTTKSTSFVLPGCYTCPSGWHTEYSGYLMTEWTTSNRGGRKDTVCIDQDPEDIPGTKGGHWPAVVHPMHASCTSTGFSCPPFNASKPLTCAVCSQ